MTLLLSRLIDKQFWGEV